MNINDLDVIRAHMGPNGTDVLRIFRDLGIRYTEAALPRGVSGYLEFDGKTYSVVVNASDSEQRRRFTAAHELGHFVLHRDLLSDGDRVHRKHTDKLYGSASEDNSPDPFEPKHEVQANRFAADVLMPRSHIAKIYDRVEDNYGELASLFKVSQDAMKIRLANLNLRALEPKR
jgi:Zn-dependent peptidase ImmA (M78 family)